MDVEQYRNYVVNPALEAIGLWSQAAEELVLGTVAQESNFKYIHQLGGGPAVGFIQMEPATHLDIWMHFLPRKPLLREKLMRMTSNKATPPLDSEIMTNLLYGAAICRTHYYRRPEALPAAGDIDAQAKYWKEHYNTIYGAGTVEEYKHNWEEYVVRRR